MLGQSPTRDDAAQQRGYRAVIKGLREVPAATAVFFWAVPVDPDDQRHPYKFEPEWGFSFVGKAAEADVRDLAASPPLR